MRLLKVFPITLRHSPRGTVEVHAFGSGMIDHLVEVSHAFFRAMILVAENQQFLIDGWWSIHG